LRQAQAAVPDEVELLKAKLADVQGGPPVTQVSPPAAVEVTDSAPILRAKPNGPQPSVAAVAARQRRPTHPVPVSCRIEWWRGYTTSQFHAKSRQRDGTEFLVMSSPSFRWRKATPPPKDLAAAAAAYSTLVAQLEADGWVVKGSQGDWYSLEMHRWPGAAPAWSPKGVA
jgi:hypothetical protein